MGLLKVSGLHKKEGGDFVLRNVDFDLGAFQKLAIVGETGSGKTTLLKMIAGLIQPDNGEILLDGLRVLGPDEKLIAGHKSIAYLSQHFELRNNYKVYEILEMANKLSLEAATEIYSICRIEHLLYRWTDELSGGEKQRIALARLLSTAPKLLLLDEPFSNLDALHKKIIQSVIHDIAQNIKMSCIMVSHDAPDILSWADNILVMRKGEVIQQGAAKHIYHKPINDYCAGLFGEYNLIDANDFNFDEKVKKQAYGKKILIRPEQIIFSSPENYNIRGTIQNIFFKGNYNLIHVLAGDQIIKVQTNSSLLSEREIVYLKVEIKDSWFV